MFLERMYKFPDLTEVFIKAAQHPPPFLALPLVLILASMPRENNKPSFHFNFLDFCEPEYFHMIF
jgi:hypothetical protein